MHHSSVSWQIGLLYFCSWNLGAHNSVKFQNFDCSGEISPNLCFDRLLLLKVYKVSAKKSMEETCPVIPKSGVKFVSKMTRIWWILIWALKSLKYLHFDWSLFCQVYNVWPKKVQGSYIWWHWRIIQILKKSWLVVSKIEWGI